MYGSTADSAGAAPRRGSSRGRRPRGGESYGKLVAFLAAKNRDVPGPEDALADAFAGRPRWRNRPE
jgi:hypothetical protein